MLQTGQHAHVTPWARASQSHHVELLAVSIFSYMYQPQTLETAAMLAYTILCNFQSLSRKVSRPATLHLNMQKGVLYYESQLYGCNTVLGLWVAIVFEHPPTLISGVLCRLLRVPDTSYKNSNVFRHTDSYN